MELRGERVTLRQAATNEIDALVELLNAPGVVEWWLGTTVDEVSLKMAGDDDVVALVVDVDGEVAGFIQYHEEDDSDYRHAGIDIALGPDHQNRGLGTDAVRTLARHLVHERGHHRLTIDPAADNQRAVRAYEKVGFRPVGVMRRYERGPDGRWRDAILMDLLAEELT